MSYQIRWFSEFSNKNSEIYKVEVLERDYTGDSSEVISGDTPITISMADTISDDVFTPVLPTRADIQWISEEDSDFDIKSLFVVDDKKYKVIVKKEEDVIWMGYIVRSECEAPYMSKPYAVSFSAVCGLALLDRQYVLDSSGRVFANDFGITIREVLAGALNSIGHELPLKMYSGITESNVPSLAPSAQESYNFLYANIGQDSFAEITYLECLTNIFNSFNCFLVQSKGAWVLQDRRVSTEEEHLEYLFNYPSYSYTSQSTVTDKLFIIDPLTSYDEFDFNGLIPHSDMIESVANPKSKATVSVEAGYPVNRLSNGRFRPSGGVINGWRFGGVNSSNNKAVSEGFGNYNDPFRLKAEDMQILPSNNFDVITSTNRIYLDIGDYDQDKLEELGLKINLQGRVRAWGTKALNIHLYVNHHDRDYSSKLLTNNSWELKKKNEIERYYSTIDSVKSAYSIKVPEVTELDKKDYNKLKEIEISITTDPITNWLRRDGKWVAYIDIFITPWPVDGFSSGTLPTLYLEDFYISIETKDAYEAVHEYEIDASDVILNGDEYTYTIGVADKINIDTPEQKRESNRVLSGYMMNALFLTKEWTRLVNGVVDPYNPTPQPIQHLSLRERIRQMCGFKRMLSGTSTGGNLWIDSTVINNIEDGWKPLAVTSWEWDIKRCQYNTEFIELDFTPLANETINLVITDENGNKRKVRASGGVYGANGGVTSGFTPIVLSDIQTIPTVVGTKMTTVEVDFADHIESNHEPEDISLRLIGEPLWTNVTIEDTVVTINGTPTTEGKSQILVEVSDGTGDEYIVSIPIITYEKSTSVFTIDGVGVISESPRVFPYEPNYSVFVTVKGGHDAVRLLLTSSSGFEYDSDITEVTFTNEATYQIITDEPLGEGTMVATAITYRIIPPLDPSDEDEVPVFGEVHRGRGIALLGENMGQDDPSRIAHIHITKDDESLVVLGTEEQILDYVDSFNIEVETIGITFDRATLSIIPEDEPYFKEFTAITVVPTPVLTNEELNPSTGYTTPSSTYKTTDFVPVNTGSEVTVTGVALIIVGYNGTDYVSQLNPTGDIVIIPDGINSIRVSSRTVAIPITVFTKLEMKLFPSDTSKPSGRYSAFFKAYSDDSLIYETFGRWVILDEIPEPVEPIAGIKIVKKDSLNSLVKELSLSADLIPLPSEGWGIMVDFIDIETDKITWELHQLTDEGWQEVNLPLYIGTPTERVYSVPSYSRTISLFGSKSSLQIGDIHGVDTRFKVLVRAYFEGVEVSAKSADWMFKEIPELGDNTSIKMVLFDSTTSNETTLYNTTPETGVVLAETKPNLIKLYAYKSEDDEQFDRVILKKSKNGTPLQLDEIGVVRVFEYPELITIDTMGIATVSDYQLGDYVLYDNSLNKVSLTNAGVYTDTYEFYNGAIMVGQSSVTYELVDYDPEPPIVDPLDCDLVYEEFEF